MKRLIKTTSLTTRGGEFLSRIERVIAWKGSVLPRFTLPRRPWNEESLTDGDLDLRAEIEYTVEVFLNGHWQFLATLAPTCEQEKFF